MEKTPESLSARNEELDDNIVTDVAITALKKNLKTRADIDRGNGGEVLNKAVQAVDFVHDHFPDDISPKQHFERDNGPNPLQTEEDYKKMFDLFLQEELVQDGYNNRSGDHKLNIIYRPYRETVNAYLSKTFDTIDDLTGESGKLPKTDVAIYLDKSARPISWFVDEFWDDATDAPKPRTEHLAIDRKAWFDHFGIELENGEYIDGADKKLAEWDNLPIHDVKQNEISELRWLLSSGTITHEELDECIEKNVKIKHQISGRAIDALLKERGLLEKIGRGEVTRKEFEDCKDEALKKIKILDIGDRLKYINEARIIAEQIRGLFVPGGLSEEDINHSEKIMDYPTGMEGKNITIIDEVERSGTTGKIAKNFISWAFPEAASVNFYVYYDPGTLNDANSAQDGQMLRIPFWYSLEHDDGTGRGILGPRKGFYEKEYEMRPDNLRRAAKFGGDFLGVPLSYEDEKGHKSLRFREQIARLRTEYEKGHIS